jgi:hypothetical protein
MPMSRALVAAIALAAMLTAGTPALACACCTNQGQRYVGVAKLEAGLREEIGRLRFLGDAELYTGEAEPADVKGIATPSSKYELHVAQEDSRDTWLLEMPVMPIALTRSSTERVDTPCT